MLTAVMCDYLVYQDMCTYALSLDLAHTHSIDKFIFYRGEKKKGGNEDRCDGFSQEGKEKRKNEKKQINGRAGNRTQDLSHTIKHAKRTLYQLSHTPFDRN